MNSEILKIEQGIFGSGFLLNNLRSTIMYLTSSLKRDELRFREAILFFDDWAVIVLIFNELDLDWTARLCDISHRPMVKNEIVFKEYKIVGG